MQLGSCPLPPFVLSLHSFFVKTPICEGLNFHHVIAIHHWIVLMMHNWFLLEVLIGCVENTSHKFWSVRCSCFVSCSSGRVHTLPVHNLWNPTEGVICFTPNKCRSWWYSHFLKCMSPQWRRALFCAVFPLSNCRLPFFFALLSLTPFCLFHHTQRVRRNYGKYTLKLFLVDCCSCHFCLVVVCLLLENTFSLTTCSPLFPLFHRQWW